MAAVGELRVVLSVDVEEEGLFSGSYPSVAPGVRNAAWLEELIPLLERTGMPVTLLCAHSIFSDADACRALDRVRARCRVEVGAHLHHWNTPPLWTGSGGAYQSAGDVPVALMEEKLRVLLEAGRAYAGHTLTSFRMGRWDLRRGHWPLLARAGILTDSSVRPLHRGDGPDHFDAPASPYVVEAEGRRILEVPMACLPVFSGLPCLLRGPLRRLRDSLRDWGLISVLPAYHSLGVMRCFTRMLAARGQGIISLAWHSSEMMPGGAPHIPDAAAARNLLRKIEDYLLWLRRHWNVRGLTLDDVRREEADRARLAEFSAGADWLC